MYNVLIVEDDPMARKLMEIFVSSNGNYQLVPSIDSAAMAELWLFRRSYMHHPTLLTAMAVCAILVVLAALVLAVMVKKNGGLWLCKKNKVRVFSKNCNYGIMFAAIVVSAAAMAVALAVYATAFYAMWALGVVLFALAVYYTVKQV